MEWSVIKGREQDAGLKVFKRGLYHFWCNVFFRGVGLELEFE